MAKIIMWIKLCQIPAYVAIFVLGMIMAITIFTIPFAIALFLLDCLALTVTGFLNFSAVIAACREGKTTWKKSWWVAVLQAVFCADVVASVIFLPYSQTKRAGNRFCLIIGKALPDGSASVLPADGKISAFTIAPPETLVYNE